jgi:hypothetical protein
MILVMFARCVLGLVVLCVGCGPRLVSRSDARLDSAVKPIDRDLSAGKIDEGIAAMLALDARARQRPGYASLVQKHEKRVRDEAGKRTKGAAFVLARDAKSAGFAIDAAAFGAAWAGELRPAIADAENANKPGTAAVLRAALANATGDANDAAEAKRAVGALREQYKLRVEVGGKGDVRGVQHAIASERIAIGRGDATITLGAVSDKKDQKRGRETVQVQQGTRKAENPKRADLEARVADHEDRIENLRMQKADEQQSPSRSQSSLEAFDYQIKVEQENLDEARRWLRDEPATIDEPNFVDIPFDVETHTLTLSRDVTIDVTAAWRGNLAQERTTVKAARSDKTNAANSGAGIKADPLQLPSIDAVMPDLDRETAKWITGALDKIAMHYYRTLIGEKGDDGLALAMVLAPEGGAYQAKNLEKTLRVPHADRLVLALDGRDRTKTVAATTKQPATSRPTPSTTTRPVAEKPAATPPATPTAPADPLRAKAGFALTIAPFTVKHAGKVVLAVDANGRLSSGTTEIAIVRSNGLIEDKQGKVMLAIDKQGDVWMPRQNAPVGKLSADKLVFQKSTMTLDASGHFVLTAPRETMRSEASIDKLDPSARSVTLLVAWLGAGKLALRKVR